MKLFKVLGALIAIGVMAVSPAFAAADESSFFSKIEAEEKLAVTESEDIRDKDPIKFLEKKKARIQALLKEGKIEKEKADAIIKRIDERIKKLKEFNKLTTAQKKEKLIQEFKAKIAEKVKAGKLTKEKGDELIKKYTEKVEKWDGKGYPDFHHREKCHRKKVRKLDRYHGDKQK